MVHNGYSSEHPVFCNPIAVTKQSDFVRQTRYMFWYQDNRTLEKAKVKIGLKILSFS
jgi:hypothetical protein